MAGGLLSPILEAEVWKLHTRSADKGSNDVAQGEGSRQPCPWQDVTTGPATIHGRPRRRLILKGEPQPGQEEPGASLTRPRWVTNRCARGGL